MPRVRAAKAREPIGRLQQSFVLNSAPPGLTIGELRNLTLRQDIVGFRRSRDIASAAVRTAGPIVDGTKLPVEPVTEIAATTCPYAANTGRQRTPYRS